MLRDGNKLVLNKSSAVFISRITLYTEHEMIYLSLTNIYSSPKSDGYLEHIEIIKFKEKEMTVL